MKHMQGAGPLFRQDSQLPRRSRHRPDWEKPFAADDPFWREWNQTKKRKEIY